MMSKKYLVWILMFAIGFSATACSSQKPNVATTAPEQFSFDNTVETESSAADSGKSKILIAYFTWAENVADAADIDASTSASVRPPGNVAQMAVWIQQEIGGDLFSIRVKDPYSTDYDECLDRAAEEKAEEARPELMERVENIADYDIVFLGYPNWWYSAPMAVFSFLEENNLTDKKVVLFCSHGTGGLASSVKDISVALPNSRIESNVLGVYRDDISESKEKVNDWLKEIGYHFNE